MIGKLLLGFWILGWINLFGDPTSAQPWDHPRLDESLDERHDAEIFRAVVESMRQWALHKKLHHRTKREVSKVCYEDVGCFEDTGPFSYLEMLPSPPKDVGTRFLVYGSRKARSIPTEFLAEDITDNAHRAIDPDLPTKVIVHGFGSGCDYVWVYEMRSALMTVQDCNIVCVDWGPGSAMPNYVRAAANTRLVGRQLAKLIRSLNVPLDKVHLIGFSLGAHVAGFAGAELGNVSRITGLDPAGPLFESQDPRARLDETDANFVDVIHSNGEQLLLGGLGSWQPMGHVDFYPNGGRMQTGCSNLFLGAVTDVIWSSAVEGRSLCNHQRAYKFFTDSVSPKCRFPAFPCDRGYDGLLKGECFPCGINGMDRPCGDMGYYSDSSPARGQLYLVTRDEEPFCAHQYQVKVYNSRGERPTRSYGKLQVTIVGEGFFNETFTMTRKDEELLVGAILQKIVVPHPAISNLEAIEIKYTAYSGWISSGLVSWSIDKVAIVDSFGKTLSVCKKGLSLESGRPVYLPLYPGECNIPAEVENVTSAVLPTIERLAQEKQGGIGPFVKEQNYEVKEPFSVEIFTKDRIQPSKGLGPFTKEQNMRIIDRKENFTVSNNFEDSSTRRTTTNPWSIIGLSNDGDSNSLENSDSESGRGFSGSNFIPRTSSAVETPSEVTTEYLPEIREPVLQIKKKETGRSLKLSEITEPILRPRSARQNTRNEVLSHEKQKDEIQEVSPSSSRGFTVQFLPERLAGILAQAERYARQTLLPLISQYTPSFVGGGRFSQPKYFPPLGDIASEESSDSKDVSGISIESSTTITNVPEVRERSGMAVISEDETVMNNNNRPTTDVPVIVDAIYPEKNSPSNPSTVQSNSSQISRKSSEIIIERRNNQWVPINNDPESGASRRDFNASRSLDWDANNNENNYNNNNNNNNHDNNNDDDQVPESNTGSNPQVNDWLPIAVDENSELLENSTQHETALTTPVINGRKETADLPAKIEIKNITAKEIPDPVKDERKYIPLTDLQHSSNLFSSTGSNNVLESRSSTFKYDSHIQKIPKVNEIRSDKNSEGSTRRSMMFPYAYEKKKDPRTRYIPLIPEEDFGTSSVSIERER